MKRRTILRLLLFQPILILFFTGCALLEPQGRIKVLFIGNSYTSSNGLPIMFERMASSGGHRANTAMIAPGGWTLADHAQSTDTIKKIRSDEWDYVVLQEQSVIPSLAGLRERQMYPAIRQLHNEIAAIGAETVLFMTWGRRDGLPSEGHQDFTHMQAALEVGYFNIGHELDLLIAPVGVAWWNALRSASRLDLWVEDGSHPNQEGTYLAACVLYAVIFGESPEGIDYTAEIADDWGLYFQTAAAQTIEANRAGWNLP